MLTLSLAKSPPAAPPSDFGSGVQIWPYQDGSVCAACETVNGRHWVHLPGIASFRFRSGSAEVASFVHPDADRELIPDHFRRIALPLGLQALGTEVLHASAVRMKSGVVAFCGISGTGKSTIAFALHQRGHSLFGDDAVAFAASGDAVHAHSLPFRIRLRPESAAFFGFERQETFFPAKPESRPRSANLAALFILQRTDVAVIDITRLSPSQAFGTLLPHSYCFHLGHKERMRAMMEGYLHLASEVPVWEIHFGEGLDKLAGILDAVEKIAQTNFQDCRAAGDPTDVAFSHVH